jgi:D-alanine-D-alanine ligase
MGKQRLRVGVLFGGRSGEHEVSLNSARNVMDALKQAGHTVLPMGITREGHWLTQGDPHKLLADHAATGQPTTNPTSALVMRNGAHTPTEEDQATWSLLPQSNPDAPLPMLDVIFPVLHGPYGEDGTVQGLLEMANLPYVGSGVAGSAVGMDKALAKQLFAQAGLRQANYVVILRKRWRAQPAQVLDEVETMLGYPAFVKPANLGSSVGISKARDRAQLAAALQLAAEYDRKLIVEQAVPNAREIEVSVLGNDDPLVSIPGEIKPGHEFYDYAAKYLDDSSQLLIPAPLSPAMVAEVQGMGLSAFRVTDCAGLARVDFLLDDATQTLYLNEINTMPGFTRISMYPKLWAASGLSYPELVSKLLELALERHADKQQNRTTREQQ